MSRARDLANLGNNATGLETLTVSDITDITATADEINLVDGSVSGPLSHRNMVINGAMQVSQRNGTSSVQLSASEQYIIDRFINDVGSSFDMKADASQSSDAPSGFANSLKLACDGVSTPTGSHNGTIATFIEGQDCQSLAYGTSDAKDVTLSFYAKSSSQNSGHTYGVMLGAFLGGARSTQTKGFTVTSSWQRFEMTFSANGTVLSTAISDDNNKGIQISFSLASGPDDLVNKTTWSSGGLEGFTGQDNFFDNTSNEFYLTGVQLELGSKATPFEHRSYGDELQKCKRYYVDGQYRGTAVTYSTIVSPPTVYFPVEMRSSPDINYGTVYTSSTDPISGLSSSITGHHFVNSKAFANYISSSSTGYGYISYLWFAEAEL